MTDFDTLRWGETQTLNVVVTPGAEEISTPPPVQMLHLHWQRPLLWKLMLSMTPQMLPGETVTWVVSEEVIVGVGQATDIIPLGPFVFAPAAGVYSPQVVFQEIPAQDIQLRFRLSIQGGGLPTNTANQAFRVSAFGAPFTEPGATAQLRDELARDQGGKITDPDQRGQPRWMPPGFHDGELRYQERGTGAPGPFIPPGWTPEQYQAWLESQGYR